MLSHLPYTDFSSAASGTLAFLQQRLGFHLWMVTRTSGEEWIVLQSRDSGYGMLPGRVLHWADSFCARMVAENGPRIVPNVIECDLYSTAPIAHRMPIQAYVGVPLKRADGSLFGTLCAMHPEPMPDTIVAELPLVELTAHLLSALLESDLRATESRRLAERMENDTQRDALTGLYNRQGWERLFAAEEDRCRRFGHPACLLEIRVNGLEEFAATLPNEDIVRRTGHAIRAATGQKHIAARIDDGPFLIFGVECDASAARTLQSRVEMALDDWGISATTYLSLRVPGNGLGVFK